MPDALLAPPPRPLAVSARGLARRHTGRWALRGVDLDVAAGDGLLVLGANGSGKTTLIRLLGTALTPSAGTLRLLGGEAEAARDRVAMVSHADHHYDDLSARENLLVGASLSPRPGSDVDAALAAVGLADRANDIVRTFSAGMRKRLSFARLLWKKPELVLLDEPYAGLDPAGGRFVDALVRDLRTAGSTVVFSTHQVARGAALCENAVLLEGGRVKWRGKAADALEHAGGPQE